LDIRDQFSSFDNDTKLKKKGIEEYPWLKFCVGHLRKEMHPKMGQQ
jgi:hypothetical protein